MNAAISRHRGLLDDGVTGTVDMGVTLMTESPARQTAMKKSDKDLLDISSCFQRTIKTMNHVPVAARLAIEAAHALMYSTDGDDTDAHTGRDRGSWGILGRVGGGLDDPPRVDAALTVVGGRTMARRLVGEHGFMHMSMTKEYAVGIIQRFDDWRNFTDPPWQGTREELTAAILEGPKLIAVGTCDNFNGETGCQGHPATA